MHVLVLNRDVRCAVVIPGSATVGELKEKVEKQTGVAADTQDLRAHGESLADEMTLAEQHIQDRDRIELHVIGQDEPEEAPAQQQQQQPSASGGAGASALAVVEAELSEASRLLADYEEKLRALQPVHQEYFTRVLEKLDCLSLDALTDSQRDQVRPIRKALVAQTEKVSAQALQREQAGPRM